MSIYPDPNIIVLDKAFAKYKIGNAAIEKISSGYRWCEGPVYFPMMRSLLWSDIPNNKIMRYQELDEHIGIFRAPSNYANGNSRDGAGRLLTCEHGGRRVTRTEHDGKIEILADNFEGKPLNAPNDLVADSKGNVWFTDPGYGIGNNYEGYAAKEELPRRVYRIDARTAKLSVVVEDLLRPNGIALNKAEDKLYVVNSVVGDEGNSAVLVYDIKDENLSGGHTFIDNFAPGTTDGIRFDEDGNLWCAMGWSIPQENGVRCYNPEGKLIGKIVLPEVCANLCFGGERGNRLYMTASTSLYALFLGVSGLR